jgi:hypothetical protein
MSTGTPMMRSGTSSKAGWTVSTFDFVGRRLCTVATVPLSESALEVDSVHVRGDKCGCNCAVNASAFAVHKAVTIRRQPAPSPQFGAEGALEVF